MSTQSTPQISDFQKINRRKNILSVSYSYEIKWCSLPCSGAGDRHAETNARLAGRSQRQLQTRLRF